jgi:hypothetical protein
MRPNGDFQHLPSWRELVVATALSLSRHHAETLIVSMSLIRDDRERLNARVTHPGQEWDQGARELGMTGVDEMVAAAARQSAGTLMLRSDRLTPAELADKVLAAAGLRQVR